MRSSDAVAELLGDEERRRALGANARVLAQERYGWDRIAERLVDVYERALGRAPVPAVAA